MAVAYTEWGALTPSEVAVADRYSHLLADTLRVLASVAVERKQGMLDICFYPIVRDGNAYKKLLSGKVVITATPKRRQVRRQTDELASERYTRTSVLASGRWVKISVEEDGVYSLTRTALKSMGFTNLDNIHVYGHGGHLLSEVSDPDTEVDDLQEVPLTKRASDYLFWGNGVVHWDGDDRVRNPYATAGCYFVTETDEANAAEGLALPDDQTSGRAHTLHEKDEYAWFSGGRNLFESTNYASTSTHTYTLAAPGWTGSGTASLKVVFTAASEDVKTVVTPTVNGTALATITISTMGSYTYAVEGSKTYDVSDLITSGSNTVRLTTTGGADARLDYLTLSYDAPYTAVDYASSTATYPAPTVLGQIDNQNLHALDSLDMVIIIPASGKLQAQADRLREAHEQYDGLRVAVVRADQVYNEFSSGTPDATAYRRLMKMLYDRGDVRYLLLMGDCAWDNRMVSTSWKACDPDDYLLCFESENSYSDTKCYVMEDYFGLLDDGEGSTLTSDKVDIGVGRFPVVSAADAKVMVDKTIAHMSNSNAGNWRNIISVIGDDGDENVHMRYADDVAERIMAANPEMEVRKVMFDAYTRVSTITSNTYPAVTTILKSQMTDGVAVMNYTGHAATYCLSHEFVLQTEDFATAQGSNLPLWVTAACDVMPFDGQSANIGETAVLNDGGAALAFYGTTRTVYTTNNLQMNRWFMRYLLGTDDSGRRYRVGDAIRLAKNYLISGNLETSNKENKLHYALLGDPALTIGAPTNRVVLDSINGQPPAANPQLSAGQKVTLTGHVENQAGETLTGFCGILSARVYDSEETVTCNNNAGASSVFTFTNRDKVLFNGQDSVTAGRFALSFVMPADINFSDEAGRVVFYAISDDLTAEANGYSEDFTVGGVADNDDTTGPEIVAYLNSDTFTNGERVNATPYFVAQLCDESGISYSGNGLGHDLTLTVDNNPSTTYTLNDYYTAQAGDYTRGTAAYSIPELEDGEHSLTFRAWDVLNNTTCVSLDFVVDSSLAPDILSVALSQNPATESTTFIINHNRAGSECDITVEVYDFAGRLMWRDRSTSTSSTGQSTVTWNLCTGSGGRLFSGVYIYKVWLSSGGSRRVSKAQKLIVASNN